MRSLLLAAAFLMALPAPRAAARPVSAVRLDLHQKVENLRVGLPINLQSEIDRMTPNYRATFSADDLDRFRQAYTNEFSVLIQLSVATDSPMLQDDLDLAQQQFERSKQRLLSLLFKICASRFPDAAGGVGTDRAAAAFDEYMQAKMAKDVEARELLKTDHLTADQRGRIGRLLENLSGLPDGSIMGWASQTLGGVRDEVAAVDPEAVKRAGKKAQALALSPADFQAPMNLRLEQAIVPPPPQEIEAVLRSRGATPEMIRAIMAASQKQGLDPLLIAAFMSAESGFKRDETNPDSGASGLMQLMPETARGWGVKNIYSIPQNVMAGAKHLTYLQALFAGEGTDFDKDDLRAARRFAIGKLAGEQAAEIRGKIAAAFGTVRDVFERARPVVTARLTQAIADAEDNVNALAVAKGWSAARTSRAIATAVRKARDQAVSSVFKDSVLSEISQDVKNIIGAYNAGEGRIKQYGGLPPFKETQRFVPRVLLRYFTNYLLAAENALGVAGLRPGPELDPAG